MFIKNKYTYSAKNLVSQMVKDGENCHYGNWGICTSEKGNVLYFGRSCKKVLLRIPLIDIIDYVEKNFPEYGMEEVFVSFKLERGGSVEWYVGLPD